MSQIPFLNWSTCVHFGTVCDVHFSQSIKMSIIPLLLFSSEMHQLNNSNSLQTAFNVDIKKSWCAPVSDLLLWVMLIGCSAMKGDWSDDRGGGARTWRPKRHFFFFISFPETNLYDRAKSDWIGIQLPFFRPRWQIFICSRASQTCQLKHLIQLFKCLRMSGINHKPWQKENGNGL